jgi:segregation and condensation protein B
MELLKQQIEALIFCSEQSISLEEIAASLKISFDWDLEDADILNAIEEIKSKYASDEFSFELAEISEGFQFLTKKQYHPAVSALIQHKAKKKLSVSQMETLAIIAYRQPISKSEVEHIRGVSCDYAVQKLLEKELIGISGKSDGPGRPVLYSTSHSFMDYFGIKSVKDLPQLKDIHVEQNEIGIPSEDGLPSESGSVSIDENILEPVLQNELTEQYSAHGSIEEHSEIESADSSSAIEESETKIFADSNIEFEPKEAIGELNDNEESFEETSVEIEISESLSDNEIAGLNMMDEERITSDLIDRKSIYLENESKNLEEEENINPDEEDNLS